MRYFACLAFVLVVACKDGDVAPDAGVQDTGSTNCTPGDTADCVDLSDDFVSGMATCSVVGLFAISECVAREGGVCVPPDGCVDGTVCAPSVSGDPRFGQCTERCEPTVEDSCGPGRACQQISETDGICADRTQMRDEGCGLGADCIEGICLPGYVGETEGVVVLECKLTCEADDHGLQGDCPAGELCLINPVGGITEAQLMPNGNPVTCVDQAPCDGGRGFVCVPQPQVGGVCLRERTWCGTAAPLLTAPLAEPPQESDVCGFPGASRYCAPLADGDAPVICSSLFEAPVDTVDQMGNRVPCTSNQQCPTFLGSECFGGFCGTALKGCLAFCESPGAPDLDCGAGLRCDRLPLADHPGFEIEVQFDSSGSFPQPCTGMNDPICELSYECVQLTATDFGCARAPKICVSP